MSFFDDLPDHQRDLYRLLLPLIDPISPYLADPEISEIFVYGPSRIVMRKQGRDHPTTAQFRSSQLKHLIQQIGTFNGRVMGFDVKKGETPILEGSLPCGSRVSGVLHGINADADSLTIRKHSKSMLKPEDLVRLGSVTEEALAFLQSVIQQDGSILVSGATDTGKTTFLNTLATFLPDGNRILVCEDTPELRINKPNVVRFRTSPTSGVGFLELLDLSMRQSGDHIIFGEIRASQQTAKGSAGSPAFPFLMALNSGHKASMTTIHANGREASLEKMVNYCFFSNAHVPERIYRASVAEAFRVVVQLGKEQGRKRVVSISEINGLSSSGLFLLRDKFILKNQILVS